MPLTDKLLSASDSYTDSISTCKLIAITRDPAMSKKDKDALLEAIRLTKEDLSFIPNSRLAALLREEGYDVSPSAVDRHRRGACSCRRLVK
jgi:hypothetical protein